MPYGITQCYLPPGRGDFPAPPLPQPKLVLDLATQWRPRRYYIAECRKVTLMDFRILSYSTVLSGSDVIPVCFCYADSYVKYRPFIFMCPHICLLAAVRLSLIHI